MNLNFLKNPFFLYCTSFGIVFMFYFLGWSKLFPSISFSVAFFFIITFFLSFFLGLMIQKAKPIEFIRIQGRNPRKVLVLIYILYAISFIHNNGIPLLLIMNKTGYEYNTFGIPFLQPIITTFTSFYTIYLFHLLISKTTKANIINLLLILLIPILIYNRGMIIISLINFAIIFFMLKSKVRLKTILWIVAISLVALYYFGKLGNYRIVNQDSTDYLLKIGEASNNFKTSNIPKEYFWTYLYVASPIANFQHTVNKNPLFNNQLMNFISYELLPDFISKKVAVPLELLETQPNRVVSFLTVGTVYSSSYNYLGWLGPILIYLYLMLIVIFYWLFLKKTNTFYITGLSILGTFIFFNIFDNMIYFSGLSFQLIYPIIYQLITKRHLQVTNAS